MKAIFFHQHGGPEVLQYTDAPTPTVRASEVLVAYVPVRSIISISGSAVASPTSRSRSHTFLAVTSPAKSPESAPT